MKPIVKNLLRIGLLIALLLGITVGVFSTWVNYKFDRYIPDSIFYTQKQKIWSHRGLTTSAPENSLASIHAALSQGAKGVEIDLFYDEQKKVFIVSHDLPVHNGEEPPLYFRTVLEEFKDACYFWLDIKNLNTLLAPELFESTEVLWNLAKKHTSPHKIIVESQYTQELKAYKKQGFYTSYWVWLPLKKGGIYSTLKLTQMKFQTIMGKFSALSMPYSLYEHYGDDFGKLPLHIFTVNDSNRLINYARDPRIQIILTDLKYYNL